MKTLLSMAILLFSWPESSLCQAKIVDVRGDVQVRHGVDQQWERVGVGDILKPEDSMMSGKRSRATILVDGRRIVIPEEVIVDVSDFRSLTQEELLLRLALERFRAVPPKDENIIIPQTTVTRGSERNSQVLRPLSADMGLLQLNGVRVLYSDGFYATCVLKAKEVFRNYPELNSKIEFRLMVASALEKENLTGEALAEYSSLASETLSPKDRAVVEERQARLKKKAG
jgi:hypothetical protein